MLSLNQLVTNDYAWYFEIYFSLKNSGQLKTSTWHYEKFLKLKTD